MPPKKISNSNNIVWNEYTKSLRTIDFSGHPIEKSAFGDRKSKYGWNIDHIIPKEMKIPDINKIENLQPTHIKTNEQKDSNMKGLIKHEYKDRFVLTEYEIDKKDKFIYIKKQIINYKNKDKNVDYYVIENVWFKDEYCIYIDGNVNKYSYLDVDSSLENKCLVFIDGQNPKKWPIAKK